MLIRIYDDSQRAEWDRFVLSNPAAGYGHLSATFDLAQATSSTLNHSLMLYDGSQRLLAVMPLFETQSRELGLVAMRQLVSGPHFPAGPLFTPEQTQKGRGRLLDELIRYVNQLARQVQADTISIAYPNVIEDRPSIVHFGYLPLRVYGFQETNLLSLLLDLRLDIDGLRRQLRERCRRALRKAANAGVKVRKIENRAQWLGCHALNLETLGGVAWSTREMEIIWDNFVATGLATMFAAIFNDAIVSVIVAIHFRSSSYYWIGLNQKSALVLGGSYAALWEAILYCKSCGCRFFELGSREFSDPKQIKISHFKESFGGMHVYSLVGKLELKPVKRMALDLGHRGVAAVRSWRLQGRPDPASRPEESTGGGTAGHP